MKTSWWKYITGVAVLAVWGAGHSVSAAESEAASDYPIDVCVVSGEPLGSMGEPYEYEHDGRRILFCCGGCVGEFEAYPEKYLKKLDGAIIEAQLPDYPLEVCVVSGEPLDEWGEPLNFVHENRLVRFCCTGCRDDFLENPKPYLDKLDQGAPTEPSAEDPTHDHRGHDHH